MIGSNVWADGRGSGCRRLRTAAGGTPYVGTHERRWLRGGKIRFSQLQFATTVFDWQGTEIALLCFDELMHSRRISSSTWSAAMARLPRPALHPCDVQPGLGQPNWTVGIKVGRDGNGGYWLLDMLRQRANPGDVEKLRSTSPRRTAHRSASGLAKTRGRPVIVRRSFGPGAQ